MCHKRRVVDRDLQETKRAGIFCEESVFWKPSKTHFAGWRISLFFSSCSSIRNMPMETFMKKKQENTILHTSHVCINWTLLLHRLAMYSQITERIFTKFIVEILEVDFVTNDFTYRQCSILTSFFKFCYQPSCAIIKLQSFFNRFNSFNKTLSIHAVVEKIKPVCLEYCS